MTSGSNPQDDPSDKYLTAFGGIVHSFAILEWSMQVLLGIFSGQHVDTVMVLTKELSYRQKRGTLYSLMEMTATEDKYKLPIQEWLDEAETFNTLRNHICHGLWTAGKRPKSIKPMTLLLRGGKGKIIGESENEKDYIDSELTAISDRLLIIRRELHQFMDAHFPHAWSR